MQSGLWRPKCMISISCTRAHDIMLSSSFVWWDSPSVKYDYWLILTGWNLRIHVGKKLQVFRFLLGRKSFSGRFFRQCRKFFVLKIFNIERKLWVFEMSCYFKKFYKICSLKKLKTPEEFRFLNTSDKVELFVNSLGSKYMKSFKFKAHQFQNILKKKEAISQFICMECI